MPGKDHANAKLLAQGLAQLGFIIPVTPETNMVWCDSANIAPAALAGMSEVMKEQVSAAATAAAAAEARAAVLGLLNQWLLHF